MSILDSDKFLLIAHLFLKNEILKCPVNILLYLKHGRKKFHQKYISVNFLLKISADF